MSLRYSCLPCLSPERDPRPGNRASVAREYESRGTSDRHLRRRRLATRAVHIERQTCGTRGACLLYMSALDTMWHGCSMTQNLEQHTAWHVCTYFKATQHACSTQGTQGPEYRNMHHEACEHQACRCLNAPFDIACCLCRFNLSKYVRVDWKRKLSCNGRRTRSKPCCHVQTSSIPSSEQHVIAQM